MKDTPIDQARLTRMTAAMSSTDKALEPTPTEEGFTDIIHVNPDSIKDRERVFNELQVSGLMEEGA